MKKIIYFLFSFLSFISVCYSQNGISGYVYDKESGEPLIGVSVYTNTLKEGTYTNNSGYFYMNIPRNDTTIVYFSYLGYRAFKKQLKQTRNGLEINLEKLDYSLDEVVISNENSQPMLPGNISLSMEQIRLLPSITGEPDVLKAFQLLPGIQQGAEGSVGLIVRGGSADQNLYLLDDVPLYYVNHLGGFASIFDVSAVKQANLYKGFFPPRYGDRLSSILDVRLKDGDLYHSKKEFTIGTLMSKFFCEGPFKDNKTSYMVSTRFCNLGLLTMLADGMYYTFYDLNTKITHRIDENNKLYFTFYSGADLIKTHYKDGGGGYSVDAKYTASNSFGDNMANARWFHVFNPYCYSNIITSFSSFYNSNSSKSEYKEVGGKTIGKEKFSSSINDFQIKGNVDFLKFSEHELKGGFVFSLQHFSPQAHAYSQESNLVKQDTTIRNSLNATQSAVYIEDNWNVHKNINLLMGARYSNFSARNKQTHQTLEPRFATKFFIADGSLHIGYSRMSQSLHLLSNNDFGIPKDLWLPSTDKIVPEVSDQFDVEIFYKISETYKLTISAYYKKLSNLIDLKSDLLSTKDWEDVLETKGKGINKGIEFLIAKEKGRLTGYFSYVLSKSTRQFQEMNGGKEYPFKYDYPHQVNIVANYKLNDVITFVASWVYHTGYAITMASGKYSLINSGPYYYEQYGEAHIYEGKNNYRMPAYHRLDIGMDYKKGQSEWHLGVYNAYNRMNPYYYYVVPEGNDYVLKQKTMFPLLPSISYTYFF